MAKSKSSLSQSERDAVARRAQAVAERSKAKRAQTKAKRSSAAKSRQGAKQSEAAAKSKKAPSWTRPKDAPVRGRGAREAAKSSSTSAKPKNALRHLTPEQKSKAQSDRLRGKADAANARRRARKVAASSRPSGQGALPGPKSNLPATTTQAAGSRGGGLASKLLRGAGRFAGPVGALATAAQGIAAVDRYGKANQGSPTKGRGSRKFGKSTVAGQIPKAPTRSAPTKSAPAGSTPKKAAPGADTRAKVGAAVASASKSDAKTRKINARADRMEARGQARQDKVGAVQTKGGSYPVYKKGSQTAQSFRGAFATARKAGKKEFSWQGRRYNTKVK